MKKGLVWLVLAALMVLQPLNVFARTIETFALDRRGWEIRTQDAYLPNVNVTDLGLSSPQSMVFGRDDVLYIADTGNARIVMFDTRTNMKAGELRFEGFVSPRGVFVTPAGRLYVGDAGAQSVFVFDENHNHIRTHGRPDAMAFGDTPFAPNRISVDVRGNMYIVGEGVFNGIIQLSSEGEFLGFFAVNRTSITLLEQIQEFVFTDRQLEALAPRLPNTFANVTVDGRGVVYSVSMGSLDALQGNPIQRHDMAGRNTLLYSWGIADAIDIAVDADGNIFVARTAGWILVMTNSGEYIFGFGAGHMDDQDIVGQFRSLQAIAVSSERHVWALDSDRNFLQSFAPTEYAQMIFYALNLFNSGLYEEAGIVWTQVLRHNQMSALAHMGMGRALLYRQYYEEARQSFYLAGHRMYYSTAFWEVRNNWMLSHLAPILIAVAAYFFIMFIVRLIDRKMVLMRKRAELKQKIMTAPYLRHILFAFSVARHPINSYYDLKNKTKGHLGGAVFHFFLFFIAYMVFQISRGFLMQIIDIAEMDFMVVIGGFFGVFFLFVFSNYLVTSIKDGEGSILDIFKLVSYGLFPLTITLFVVTALSHIVTFNEVFLLNLVMAFGGAYTVAVLWVGFQEVHNYNFKSTFSSLFITSVFMLIALVVVFNITIMFDEILQFFESIGREVYANVTEMY